MFSKLATKVALQRAGLGDVKIPSFPKSESSKNADGSPSEGFANPFANVQWPPKAFSSWQAPPAPPVVVREPPQIGDRASSNVKLKFPAIDGRPVVVVFLRYCGCPFTEKIFIALRAMANRHSSIHFIAISHCTPAATNEWVNKLGGAWNVDVVVDQARELYALWGMGVSNWGHLLHPRNGYNQILLGKKEGVWGQQVGEGGSRWQVGGAFAVDERGIIKWGKPMASVDEEVMLDEAVRALGFNVSERRGVA